MAQSNQVEATSLLGQIPFGAIIGGPLKAAVDAQAMAAQACYEFIKNVGFEETPKIGDDGKPVPLLGPNGQPVVQNGQQLSVMERTKVRDVTFVFERLSPPVKDANGNLQPPGPPARASITVPLLSVMPLPFIRIKSMDISFKASISAVDGRSQTDTSSSDKQLKGDATLGFGWWKVNASGSISSKKDSTATSTSKYSVEHTMDINVSAVQDDMPAGLAKILAIMGESIAVTRG
jgi:hypothetical protein